MACEWHAWAGLGALDGAKKGAEEAKTAPNPAFLSGKPGKARGLQVGLIGHEADGPPGWTDSEVGHTGQDCRSMYLCSRECIRIVASHILDSASCTGIMCHVTVLTVLHDTARGRRI